MCDVWWGVRCAVCGMGCGVSGVVKPWVCGSVIDAVSSIPAEIIHRIATAGPLVFSAKQFKNNCLAEKPAVLSPPCIVHKRIATETDFARLGFSHRKCSHMPTDCCRMLTNC